MAQILDHRTDPPGRTSVVTDHERLAVQIADRLEVMSFGQRARALMVLPAQALRSLDVATDPTR